MGTENPLPDGLPPLREVIARHGLSARKGLGQNFLLDLNLTRRIARLAEPLAGRTVLEVGPGPGGLTRALLAEGAERVIAIERDARCLPALEEIAAAYPGRLDIHEADALTVDVARLLPPNSLIAANLPYNIATSLLTNWLSLEAWPPPFTGMTLMFQKEVAERIVAAPGSRAYGRLSVLAQWRSRPRIALTLPPAAFTPPPKVASAVVTFEILTKPEGDCSLRALERVTRAAFGQRRKMLRRALRSIFPAPEMVLQSLGIPPEHRAEDLTVAQFCALARQLSER